MAKRCAHLDQVKDAAPLTPDGCEESLAMGSDWVHLRLCLSCGDVGCNAGDTATDVRGPHSGTSWPILIHQIPPKPNYLPVKVWRRLQRLGATAVKNSVYVLPRSEQAQEDLR